MLHKNEFVRDLVLSTEWLENGHKPPHLEASQNYNLDFDWNS